MYFVLLNEGSLHCNNAYKMVFCISGKVRRGQTIPDNDALVQVIKMRPEILQQMLQTVLNIIMFEDCRNQWSMSRPLLGLILLNEDYFSQLRDQLISSQPASKQTSMATWFKNLMEGIERNLLTKNRDRFTQNLSVFRRDINDSLKGEKKLARLINVLLLKLSAGLSFSQLAGRVYSRGEN